MGKDFLSDLKDGAFYIGSIFFSSILLFIFLTSLVSCNSNDNWEKNRPIRPSQLDTINIK